MNDLVKVEQTMLSDISKHMPKYDMMIQNISKDLPAINEMSLNFMKTQSQYMDNMMTVSHPTPIRNIRQILAEIKKTRNALIEASNKNAIRRANLKIKEHDIGNCKGALDENLMMAEAKEISDNIMMTEEYMTGAIKKLENYRTQIHSIKKSMNIKSFDEVDFEAEEERYHVMTAFNQALIAARSRGGTVDEGNHIYFQQIGINGASAQREVRNHLTSEGKMIHENREPTHNMVLGFLNAVAEKYEGCSKVYAEKKGMKVFTKSAALTEK